MLVDSGTEFVDDKISFQVLVMCVANRVLLLIHVVSLFQAISGGNWINMKHNEKISGPFGALPVLQWDKVNLGQVS